MLNLIKKYKYLLIIFSILFITTLSICTIKVDYVSYVPGEVSEVGNVIEINTENKSNNYYSTSVYYVDRITLFQKLIFTNMKQAEVYKKNKAITTEIDRLQGEIEHNSAIYTSLISAYNAAEIDLDYEFKGIYVYYAKDMNLNVGDVVLGSNYEECKNNLKNNKEETITLEKKETSQVTLEYPYYEIHNEDILVYPSNNGGPSAGFMQALKLYDDLVSWDCNRNYKIAGTGTIDENGNVGAIGCVGLKIYTAIENNCDIFFIPYENKEEAEETLKGIDTDMTIIYVNRLEDAIRLLKGLENE